MLVSDILKTKGYEVISTTPKATVAAAARQLSDKRIGSVLVMNGDAIAGILSERDIVCALAEQGAGCLDRSVGDLMTSSVVTCRPDQTIADVMEKMTTGRFRHVPVVDGGRVVGMISIGDVVKYRLAEAQDEVAHLAAYVAGS
ncbi:MAG: CBS domain-containing protein [Alphaproteobacteria bacterium]|nr:CBS domain-containing protein [Alphaproteobacteria bacterium]